MSSLQEFRQSTRDWLRANCPLSMRTAMVQEKNVWGGRNAQFSNPDSQFRRLRDSLDETGSDRESWQQRLNLGRAGMAIAEDYGGFDCSILGVVR